MGLMAFGLCATIWLSGCSDSEEDHFYCSIGRAEAANVYLEIINFTGKLQELIQNGPNVVGNCTYNSAADSHRCESLPSFPKQFTSLGTSAFVETIQSINDISLKSLSFWCNEADQWIIDVKATIPRIIIAGEIDASGFGFSKHYDFKCRSSDDCLFDSETEFPGGLNAHAYGTLECVNTDSAFPIFMLDDKQGNLGGGIKFRGANPSIEFEGVQIMGVGFLLAAAADVYFPYHPFKLTGILGKICNSSKVQYWDPSILSTSHERPRMQISLLVLSFCAAFAAVSMLLLVIARASPKRCSLQERLIVGA